MFVRVPEVRKRVMKEKIHPKYVETKVTCGCGNSFVTRSTQKELKVDISQSCLVIGGTVSGIACAVRLAEMGIDVHLLDGSQELEEVRDSDLPQIKILLAKLSNNENVSMLNPATVVDSQGYLGNFHVTINQQGKEATVKVGAVILASGKSIEQGKEGSPFFLKIGSLELIKWYSLPPIVIFFI